MKKLSSIATIMSIGLALAAGACGKDKKQATTDPAAAAAPADPAAKPADPNAAPAPADPNAAKPEEKKAGGW